MLAGHRINDAKLRHTVDYGRVMMILVVCRISLHNPSRLFQLNHLLLHLYNQFTYITNKIIKAARVPAQLLLGLG